MSDADKVTFDVPGEVQPSGDGIPFGTTPGRESIPAPTSDRSTPQAQPAPQALPQASTTPANGGPAANSPGESKS